MLEEPVMSATLTDVPSTKPFIHVILEPELLERIDDFRFGYRLPSRNAAIRFLLMAALDQDPVPEPDLEKLDRAQKARRRRSPGQA